MKFKERRGNVFVFDIDGDDHYLTLENHLYYYNSGVVAVAKSEGLIKVKTFSLCSYSRVETAVNLMQILIKEGLV